MKNLQNNISILIVENDLRELRALGNLLKGPGHNLLYATTGAQAFDIFSEKHPDVILLNTMIGSANDYEFLSLISGAKRSVAPVILMGADASPELIAAIEGHTWIDFIQKPLTAEKLLFRIHRHREHVFLRYRDDRNPSPDPSAPKIKEGINTASRGKVLLVEDHALNQAYTSAVLSGSGYEVILAETGRQAIDKTISYTPDLILLDIALPDIDGATVLERISVSGNCPPVIVLSGYSEKELRKIYPSMSANVYLLKPVNPVELINQVKQYMKSPLKNNSVKSENLLYDYSRVLEIVESSGISFHECLSEFIVALDLCDSDIASVLEGIKPEPHPKTFHEVLNYSVYFGATELKQTIWKLKERERGNADPELKPLLLLIKQEIQLLLKFYRKLSRNKDLF